MLICVISAPAVSNARRLAEIVRKAIGECWNAWQTKVPRRIRYSIYAGALLGLAFYPILGFCGAGVLKGSIAAAIQSSIGNVAAGSLFAIMQSLGAKGILVWLLPLVGAVITPVVVELIVWIHNRIRRILKYLVPFGSAAIAQLEEMMETIQNRIREMVKLTQYRSTPTFLLAM
ncbi:hypothetical protein FRC01_003665 [Tulasnella sp. 417]|nr:hypothetical protein FRC01_003665 [Tulasnella sp. 417]